MELSTHEGDPTTYYTLSSEDNDEAEFLIKLAEYLPTYEGEKFRLGDKRIESCCSHQCVELDLEFDQDGGEND
ncbi:MAG: hypothetical protein AAB522_00530 [Patescibacteria group bacterium]